MKHGFGEQIAEHRKQFLTADNPLTSAPEETREWTSEEAKPEQLDLLRYKTRMR